MQRLLAVMCAGGLGCGARYLVGVAAEARFGSAFPAGTLFVNLLGCLLMGFVTRVALDASLLSPVMRIALTTGFLGGFTTYSSFNLECTRLLGEGRVGLFALNLFGTLIGGGTMGLLGHVLAGRLFST